MSTIKVIPKKYPASGNPTNFPDNAPFCPGGILWAVSLGPAIKYSFDFKKNDTLRIAIETSIKKTWSNKWDIELEKSIKVYKIFWTREFLRFIKTQIETKTLNSIANEIGISRYPKYAHHDLLNEFLYYAVRRINENNNLMDLLKKEIQNLSTNIQCKICGEPFRPLDTHEVFFDVCNAKIEYCKPCIAQCVWKSEEFLNPDMTIKDKDLLLKDLFNLYEYSKTIPTSKIGTLDGYDFLKSIPDETRTDALLQLYIMRPYKDYVEMFGSWFKALVESGILSDGSLKTSRGVKCLALDGHDCFSLLEKQFDDWLYTNGIKHKKEPYYPRHDVYNPNENMRADFLINDIFVEIWGLKGDKAYDEKIVIKRKILYENNQRLIEIEPKDFINLNSKINKLVKE